MSSSKPSVTPFAEHLFRQYDLSHKMVTTLADDFTVEAMAAVGKPGRKDDLPEDFQARESPNTRKPLSELVFEGRYRG